MLRRIAVGLATMVAIGAGVVQAQDSSTTPPPTTAPESSAPTSDPHASTTIAPTTTLDPVAAEEHAVTTAATQAHAAALALFATPGDPAAIAALDDFYVAGSTARTTIETEAQQLVDAGTRIRENADSPGSFTVEQVTLAAGTPSTTADLIVCAVLAQVEITATPGSSVPDTSDQIVAETLTARRATYHMVKGDDGHWRIDTTNVTATFDGQTSCPVDPVAAEEALIAQRVQEIDAIRWSAVFSPGSPGVSEALDSAYTENGIARQVVDNDLETLRTQGWEARPNPTVPQSITVEQIQLLDGPPATRADVVVCIIDPNILVDPGALPDGSDMIVNDVIGAYRSTLHLFIEDGTWQLDEVEPIDEWKGVSSCPAG